MAKLTLPKCWSGSNIKKVSTVTSSPDLWLRGQRSIKVKSQTTWNDKSNTVNVSILVKHQKSPWWPLHIRPTDKRSKVKKVISQTTSNDKSSTVNLFIFAKHQKCTRWPLRVTNGWGCWHRAYRKSVCNNPFIWATVKGSKILVKGCVTW